MTAEAIGFRTLETSSYMEIVEETREMEHLV